MARRELDYVRNVSTNKDRADLVYTINRLRIEIPGPWCDAWLYKEHLLLWGRSGQLLWCRQSEILQYIEREINREVAILVELLIFRNDWKSGAAFRRLSLLPGLLDAVLQMHPGGDEELVLTIPVSPQPAEMEAAPGANLDNYIYANRLYIGTSAGLFQTYFNPKQPAARQEMVQHLETRVPRVCARYSSLHASAEEEGLWFDRIAIGEAHWLDATFELQRIADVSFSASYSTYNILNYTSDPVPRFLRARVTDGRAHERAQYDEKIVLGYDAEANIEGLTRAALLTSKKVNIQEVESQQILEDSEEPLPQIIGNSGRLMLAYWASQLSTVRIDAPQRKPIQAKKAFNFDRRTSLTLLPHDILGTHSIEGGFVVELYDEIRYLSRHGSYLLFAGPAARVRTFPQAIRHKQATVVVGEESVNILGFIETEQEESSRSRTPIL